MKNSLMNISGKLDCKIVDTIRKISKLCDEKQLAFFIIGATARDIILEHYYGLKSLRATKDIDFAVVIEREEQFSDIKESLIEQGKFEKTKYWHRLISTDGILVDILPFSIASDKLDLFYPPVAEKESPLTVTGFADCFKHTVSVIISKEDNLQVKVVSLAGLALLKIVAWGENISRQGKDASDLYHIINSYLHAGHFDKISDEDAHILESMNFLCASAIFLGKDIAHIASGNTKDKVVEILSNADGEDENKIVTCLFSDSNNPVIDYDKTCEIFRCLLKGIESS